MKQHQCKRITLAQNPISLIEQCSCGSIHLTIGAITLRVQPSAFRTLATSVAEALSELEVAPVTYRPINIELLS